jgi:hypothetical protein
MCPARIYTRYRKRQERTLTSPDATRRTIAHHTRTPIREPPRTTSPGLHRPLDCKMPSNAVTTVPCQQMPRSRTHATLRGARTTTTGCKPTGCKPTGCKPTGCKPTGCKPTHVIAEVPLLHRADTAREDLTRRERHLHPALRDDSSTAWLAALHIVWLLALVTARLAVAHAAREVEERLGKIERPHVRESVTHMVTGRWNGAGCRRARACAGKMGATQPSATCVMTACG